MASYRLYHRCSLPAEYTGENVSHYPGTATETLRTTAVDCSLLISTQIHMEYRRTYVTAFGNIPRAQASLAKSHIDFEPKIWILINSLPSEYYAKADNPR